MDATHTAPEMAGIPVLMLHATRDRAVPSETGEALWRLLERPERWASGVGHEMIFVMLPTQAGRMQAWIERAVGIAGDEAEPAQDDAGGGEGP
jgi:predicted esterase